MSNAIRRHSGYVTLFSILVISAIAVTITLSVILIGIATNKSSQTTGQSKQANAAATACAEEALEQIKENTALTGTFTLTPGGVSCTYVIINTGVTSREIDASSTAGDATRRIKVLISALSPLITVSSWQEVADF